MELLPSFLDYNRIDAMSEKHRRAFALLKGPARLISVKSTWTFGSPSVLYVFWREAGRLNEELAQMDGCMPFYYRLTQGHGSGAESVMRAEAALCRGSFEQAEILCHKAMFAADSRRQSSIYQCGLLLLARLALLRADRDGFERALEALDSRMNQNTEDLCRYTADLIKGFLGAVLNRQSLVADWLSAGEIDGRRLVIMTVPFGQMIYGRLLLKRGEYFKLLGACEHFIETASIFPNLLPQVYSLISLAAAQERLGSRNEAEAMLLRALALARDDMVVLPFAENFDELESIFARIDTGSAEFSKVLGTLSKKMAAGRAALSPAGGVLTKREREIALLARDNLTTAAIAEKLFLSERTVRNTLSRVYEKLDIAGKKELSRIKM